MKPILGEDGLRKLGELARSRVLLAFDFDGTLAPIVADRDAAGMRPQTRELLAGLGAKYPCAVITGRGLQDVTGRLEGAEVKYFVGNHGLEPSPGMETFEHSIDRAHDELAGQFADHAGLDIERKRFSLAVHYRGASDRGEAERRIHSAIAALPVAVRTVPGILVVNVVPEGAPDKGDALVQLKEAEGAEAALYVGDDVTDEDVFRLDAAGHVVGVRVGESVSSAAAYFLRDQYEVDDLLRILLQLRADDGR